jgi:2-polyprenyl-6-hydroxyphenyl methylase/3-demethylubiquinone-9 3-methyltransferase
MSLQEEVGRFERLSRTWWNARGPMRPLHVLNALRLRWVEARLAEQFGAAQSLQGLRILDLGCGGGLMAEPLAARGATVVGIDAAPGNIEAARRHAQERGVAVDYRLGDGTAPLANGELFDVVLVLEVVEHVDDVAGFMANAAARVRPGGLLIASTLNRTWRSWLLGIFMAEYVLRVLPIGTHQWAQFVKPQELTAHACAAGLQPTNLVGLRYWPVLHRASWTRDLSVNYQAAYRRR